MKRKPREKAIWYGLVATGIWVAAATAYVAVPCIPSGVTCERLRLGELGDFLSGVAAPLAFMWFVIAVFLQLEELRQNREIMELQAKELAVQSKGLERIHSQQEKLVSIEKQNVQPNLTIGAHRIGKSQFSAEGANHGGAATRVVIRDVSPFLNVRCHNKGVLAADSLALHLRWQKDATQLWFSVEFDDVLDQRRWQRYAYLNGKWAKVADGEEG